MENCWRLPAATTHNQKPARPPQSPPSRSRDPGSKPAIADEVFHRVEDATLHLLLRANNVASTTWLGFGFAESTSGHMKGSDLVTVQITNGVATVDDRYADFAANGYDESTGVSTLSTLMATKDKHNDTDKGQHTNNSTS